LVLIVIGYDRNGQYMRKGYIISSFIFIFKQKLLFKLSLQRAAKNPRYKQE